MAGTIPLSMTQQFDVLGQPLAGGQLYLMIAGTVSTPQNGYQDLALTVPLPNPMTLDAAGRIPQFFLADGYIKVRLQDKHGVVQFASDNILVVGPSSGSGGGGATIDATTIFQTGDLKARYDTVAAGAHAGWVPCNGLTIGNSTSGATKADTLACSALFIHLYNKDSTLVVSGGRTGNASNDFAANKTIATPDYRGYALAALDDMGNAASSRIDTLGAAATTLGGIGGVQVRALAVGNIPAHTHSGTTGNDSPDHTHGFTAPLDAGIVSDVTPGSVRGNTVNQSLNTGGASARHAHPFTTDGGAGLSGIPFNILGPIKLCTIYIKL